MVIEAGQLNISDTCRSAKFNGINSLENAVCFSSKLIIVSRLACVRCFGISLSFLKDGLVSSQLISSSSMT